MVRYYSCINMNEMGAKILSHGTNRNYENVGHLIGEKKQ